MGLVPPSELLAGGRAFIGTYALTRTYEDLMAAGVMAPAMVVRVALQNAASVAGLMLTTECLIAPRAT